MHASTQTWTLIGFSPLTQSNDWVGVLPPKKGGTKKKGSCFCSNSRMLLFCFVLSTWIGKYARKFEMEDGNTVIEFVRSCGVLFAEDYTMLAEQDIKKDCTIRVSQHPCIEESGSESAVIQTKVEYQWLREFSHDRQACHGIRFCRNEKIAW